MRTVFVDSAYYIALLSSADQHHVSAREFTAGFAGSFVTTVWVLVEVGNFLRRGENRRLFVDFLAALRSDERVSLLGGDLETFDAGLALYAERADKNWSLTDCISFVVMQHEGLREALTTDHHFAQAGFSVLIG